MKNGRSRAPLQKNKFDDIREFATNLSRGGQKATLFSNLIAGLSIATGDDELMEAE
jgi:hypothetical protein